jgi:hypothetical protein
MPNGGPGHCGNCCYFDANSSHCNLRDALIQSSHWTTCRSRNSQNSEIIGPIYAIVCEVKDGAAAYGSIPYYDGCRVDAVQGPDGGDTVVKFVANEGDSHEFASVSEYMDFYEGAGRET